MVGVSGPDHGGVDGGGGVDVLEPGGGFAVVGAGLDCGGELVGPGGCVGVGVGTFCLLGDLGVPGGVEVCVDAVESGFDGVAADVEVLDVQRLVDVADEMDDPFECFYLFVLAEGGVECAAGIVRDGGYNATFIGAVSLVVDVAA